MRWNEENRPHIQIAVDFEKVAGLDALFCQPAAEEDAVRELAKDVCENPGA
ncbi:hypothetical protein [Streptomyces sp. NEAU-L66]|uniref:hypothetical protein n=1 Tax=Streptomyces sp. NEAU-L66 TaxID=3390812 RepID=UPI0039C5E3A2